MEQIDLGKIAVDVIKKDIKNIHLSVYPPTGRVRIAAPLRMKLDTIRVFAISKLGWIKKQQQKLSAQERETPREYIDRESHYFFGQRYLLKVIEEEEMPDVKLNHNHIILQIRPKTNKNHRHDILEEWYRAQIKEAVVPLISKWETRLGVQVKKFFVQKMKTKWGSCNHKAKTIRLNTDLARKPLEYLEYIIVHEMTHLLEPTHNSRFVDLMNKFMPKWQFYRNELNRLPVSYESWKS